MRPRLGASFSPRRARNAGLDWRVAFKQVIELGLTPIRLSAYWDEIDEAGFGGLDWLVAEASAAGRELLLTVGMKAQGWPEFYVPKRLWPVAGHGTDVAAASADLRREALSLVTTTVRRYRDRQGVVAWQIENEPLNPSGPDRWWIGPDFVATEMAVARELDPGRPLALNVFARFNTQLDSASIRHRWELGRLLGRKHGRPEAEALALLRPNDILGLDVYRRIGYRRFGLRLLTRSRHWRRNTARWVTEAAAQGKRTWVVEAQAEPWESEPDPGRRHRSARADDLARTVTGLTGAGCDTVLLWGVEHWLARAAAGDDSWLAAFRALSPLSYDVQP